MPYHKTIHAVREDLVDVFAKLDTWFDREQSLGTHRLASGGWTTIRMTVNNLGRIDLYQWLRFLAHHARRHITQMENNAREAQAGS